MGTLIGLAVLAAIDWYLFRKTGLHIHQLIAKKYAEYLDGKENRKQSFWATALLYMTSDYYHVGMNDKFVLLHIRAM